MSRDHVDHRDIVRFAQERVNLPKDKADEHRAQAQRLRDKLEGYLREHPDFSLRRMMLSGSLAKGTSLRSINDIDVATYISGADAPHELKALLEYLAERLRTAFPNFKPEQVQPQTYSVTVSFRSSGLDVDVVPILYDGDPNWHGNLISQEDGSLLTTSIPRHIEFTRRRKQKQETHFAQVVRLVKFWAKKVKSENESFRFKSFMVELILAHLCDQGLDFSDYPEALQHFFTFVARSNMRKKLVFADYYIASAVGAFRNPVQIIDPVNAGNNVARLYTDAQADAIVEAALDAGDAIEAALKVLTKEQTLYYWRRVSAPPFRCELAMSMSFTITDAITFTITHARHLANKVGTDLKRMQRFYKAPSDADIAAYEGELIELLRLGYLGKVEYGFKRDGEWIVPTLTYTARQLADANGEDDDDPGKVRPGADISGAHFGTYLSYNSVWDLLSQTERDAVKQRLPVKRVGASQPGISGYWSRDLSYSAGGVSLGRSSLRSY